MAIPDGVPLALGIGFAIGIMLGHWMSWRPVHARLAAAQQLLDDLRAKQAEQEAAVSETAGDKT